MPFFSVHLAAFSCEPTYTWNGKFTTTTTNMKHQDGLVVFSNKVFVGGIPWDVTDGIIISKLILITIIYQKTKV